MEGKTILLGQFRMSKFSGTETWTYAFARELLIRGYNVDLITGETGFLTDKLKSEFGDKFEVNKPRLKHYNVCFANHNTIVNDIRDKYNPTMLVQTCHGTTPDLEQPSPLADKYIAISYEVKKHLLKNYKFDSEVIANGIDCERFKPINHINKEIKTIGSFCQDPKAIKKVKEVAKILGANVAVMNKNENARFEMDKVINECDVIVGLGRGIYEAMACGRVCFVYDARAYNGELSDGVVKDDFQYIAYHNASGRSYQLKPSAEEIATDLKNHYSQDLGDRMRQIALGSLNIKIQIDKYLEYADYRKYSLGR